ncbi:MAG: bifunctional glutamate N-acetyltransferase/amino-acid acetyltransferase ArgJ [Lachnospiraceae bacterium]|nr:bifunctional glutamate N-acetyltransferase/amino-acid acetyltransferase ArgJ [Lachnospiraceae bacterium]
MKKINGGVTAAMGFEATATAAEIKYKGRNDMALVYSTVPAKVAGVFTKNVVKAAPVKWDIDIVKNEEFAQAVVLNSGIANACTSKIGEEINQEMAKAVSENLQIPLRSVLTASTGVIGMQIPVERAKKGIAAMAKNLDSSVEAGHNAACAIMTTDTVSKECAVQFTIDDKVVTIGGMSKGSGMIHPDMATMLCVITTDIAISKDLLQEAVKNDVQDSFNMISVDRDTSTNDSMIVLANGKAENKEITTKDANYDSFCKALAIVTHTLAKMMASDGEGATKLFEAKVIHAKTKNDAIVLSKSVITSNLVKTAVYGSDANWGRIICALGYAGVEFDPDIVDLYIESNGTRIKLFENGIATDYSEEEATKVLSAEEVTAIADMKLGTESATAWGCDLTYDYVKINGDYRS